MGLDRSGDNLAVTEQCTSFHSAPPSSVAADVYVTRAQQAGDSRPWPIHSPSHSHCPTVVTVSGMAHR